MPRGSNLLVERKHSSSIDHLRSRCDQMPFFKDLCAFPNQKLGFQLLESFEQASGNNVSGRLSINSFLSQFNLSKMHFTSQKPNFQIPITPYNHTVNKKMTLQNTKHSTQNVVNLQFASEVKKQQSQSQVDQKSQLMVQVSNIMNGRSPFSIISNSSSKLSSQLNPGDLSIDALEAENSLESDQDELIDSSQLYQANIIRRSQQQQVEELKDFEQQEALMGMILEIEDEQMASLQVEFQQMKEDQYLLPIEVEEIEIQEAEEEEEPRQHLKKLKVKKQRFEEEPMLKIVPSKFQQILQMDLENLNDHKRVLIAIQILEHAKFQKIINKRMRGEFIRPKIIRHDFTEKIYDILINEDEKKVKQQGLKKYKKLLKKKEIIYQLSESSSDDHLRSSSSSSDSSWSEPEERVEPKYAKHSTLKQRPLPAAEEQKVNPKITQSILKKRHKSHHRVSFQNRPLNVNLNNKMASEDLLELESVSFKEKDQSQMNSASMNSIIRDISNERELARKVIPSSSSNVVNLDHHRFEQLLDQNRDKTCDCEPSILIVEDTEFNMMTICSLVKTKFEIVPFEAQNGQIAIDMVKESLRKPCKCLNRGFQLIIMDINMPIKDGFQATKEILSIMKHSGLQQEPIVEVDKFCNVIALTSYTGDDVKKKCREVNMKEIFNKPLNSDQLQEAIFKYFFQSKEGFVHFYQMRMLREVISQQMIS